MNPIFVDTQYIIATFQENDQWHQKAKSLEPRIANRSYVTTDAVLWEVLNYFSGFGDQVRSEVAAIIHDIFTQSDFLVIEQTRNEFLDGLELYESRLDKGYSLTDCISMNVCKKFGIKEILTHDRHFEQEGFDILL